MLGRDHALTGAVAFAAVAPLLHVHSPAGLAAGAVFTAGAATAPDIDEPGSTVARTYGFITESFAWVIRHLSGGHRKGTHSLIGVAVFTAASWLAVHFDHTLGGKIAIGVLLAVLLSSALAALHIGGHHGDALACGAAGAAVYWHADLRLVPLCIALGAVAHIAGDCLTHHGCPILFPMSREDYHLLPHDMQFTTGKWAETWLVSPLLIVGLLFLAWHDTGASGIAQHIHLAGYTGR